METQKTKSTNMQTTAKTESDLKPVGSIWLKSGKVEFLSMSIKTTDLIINSDETKLIAFPYKNKKDGIQSPDFIIYQSIK